MDLKVLGASNIPSGKYDNIYIKGKSRLLGDVESNNISVSGTIKGESVVCDGEIKISGRALFNKNIKSEELEINGSLSCYGDIEVTNEIDINGSITCNNLKTNEFELGFCGKSVVESINARNVEIDMGFNRRFLRGVLFFSCKKQQELNVKINKQIEGEDVSIKYVTCPKVTGKNVTIGDGCVIDLVEYNDVITISPKAKVGKVNKI